MVEFISPKQLYDRYSKSISMQTIANWRSLGTGPVYTKIGGRVMYRMDDVVEWENSRRRKK